MIEMSLTTVGLTVETHGHTFVTRRLPEDVVLDNGPNIHWGTMQKIKANGIQHIQCSTYHSSSNGQLRDLFACS